MTNPAAVSVIVPCFNAGRFLRECLQSVFDQSYAPLQIILVDDGSTDGAAAQMREDHRIEYLHQPHLGVSAARNLGLTAVRGTFVAFIDADDQWTANKIESQVQYLSEHYTVACVEGHMRDFLEPGVPQPAWTTAQSLSPSGIPGRGTATMLARREVFEKVGEFKTELEIGEDLDWYIRARTLEVSFATLREVVLLRRIHADNLSHTESDHRSRLLKILRGTLSPRG